MNYVMVEFINYSLRIVGSSNDRDALVKDLKKYETISSKYIDFQDDGTNLWISPLPMDVSSALFNDGNIDRASSVGRGSWDSSGCDDSWESSSC